MADKAPIHSDSQISQPDITEANDNEMRTKHNATISDLENQDDVSDDLPSAPKEKSAFKALGWLDRYLAIWILLAIILGILLGNFAPDAAAQLDRGRFVGVSVPIGTSCLCFPYFPLPLSWTTISACVLPKAGQVKITKYDLIVDMLTIKRFPS